MAKIKLYFDKGYQPDWDPKKEPKPSMLVCGDSAEIDEAEAKRLIKAGAARRYEDVVDETSGDDAGATEKA